MNPKGTQFATAEGKEIEVDNKYKELGVFQVRIWDTHTGKELRRLPQESEVYDLIYSPDGDFLAIKLTKKVLVYQTSDWAIAKEIDLKRGKQYFYFGKVAFGIDNRVVVMGVTNFITIEDLNGKNSRQLRDRGELCG